MTEPQEGKGCTTPFAPYHMTDWSFAHARPERGVVRVRMRVQNLYVRATQRVGALPQRMKNEWNKWKNNFYEMKGDVGMSLHEKERNKKMPTKDTKSLITPSLHLCFFQDYNVHFHAGNWMSRCCAVCFA